MGLEAQGTNKKGLGASGDPSPTGPGQGLLALCGPIPLLQYCFHLQEESAFQGEKTIRGEQEESACQRAVV